VEAAILQAFPAASGWRLSEANVGYSADLDRRLYVDLPEAPAVGRIGRHPRFDCVRQRQTGAWSCGDHWQMLWQVERIGSGVGRCAGPVIGLDVSWAASDEAILEVIDFFSYPATAKAALTATGKCRWISTDTLCRPAFLAGGEGYRSDSEPADLAVHFRNGPSSYAMVRMNRHCDGVGPCVFEAVNCVAVSVD